MNVGVIRTCAKAHERRLPLHPDHLAKLPGALKGRLYFEQGYGEPFGLTDAQVAVDAGGVASRADLLAAMDAVILLKPSVADLQALPEGGILWGWSHAVQQRAIAQAAIERKLTLVAFEAMYARGNHVFHRNNRLAGYCAVLHGLSLCGIDGLYGPARRAVVLGFGAAGRGAVQALQALGFQDITVATLEREDELADRPAGCRFVQIQGTTCVGPAGAEGPLLPLLCEADVLVNAVLQDPLHPITFVSEQEVACLKPRSLILDVSCDEGMGFSFARPTTFAAPLLAVGHCHYYAVDHTPSYLWDSASWEISAALTPYLAEFVRGPEAWQPEGTLGRAIDIERGHVRNPKILAFQGREAAYPHDVKARPG
ncbi:MAG: transhydrogenase subunit alpha [Cyanobacteria bacterium RYN_339]|nr:transhydrogenase subunit alpha [Cyanobacteria bacterium RYN_339]